MEIITNCPICKHNLLKEFYTFSLCKLYYCSHCFHTTVLVASYTGFDQLTNINTIPHPPVYDDMVFNEDELEHLIGMKHTNCITLHARVLSSSHDPNKTMKLIYNYLNQDQARMVKVICLNNIFVCRTKIPTMINSDHQVQHHYSTNSFRHLCTLNKIKIEDVYTDNFLSIFTIKLDHTKATNSQPLVEALLDEVEAGLYSDSAFENYKADMHRCGVLLRALFCSKVKQD
jgi:hypothetical protein